MKFKKGDKVRRIGTSFHGMPAGWEGVIKRIKDTDEKHLVFADYGYTGFSSKYFVLVESNNMFEI